MGRDDIFREGNTVADKLAGYGRSLIPLTSVADDAVFWDTPSPFVLYAFNKDHALCDPLCNPFPCL